MAARVGRNMKVVEREVGDLCSAKAMVRHVGSLDAREAAEDVAPDGRVLVTENRRRAHVSVGENLGHRSERVAAAEHQWQ
jgi:hypothetical protein